MSDQGALMVVEGMDDLHLLGALRACALSSVEPTAGAGGGQPADYRDDELELVDDDDPELDLLDDLDDWDGD